jgi:exfoliative toxin A/B
VPLAGLMLGLASTGNLVSDYRWFFGFFSVAILVVLIIKITHDSKSLRDELRNPAIAGISSTFPIGVAILSTYLKPYQPDLAFATWVTMLLIHIALIVYFTKSFMLKFDVKKYLPCYFVVYVGLSVNAIIAPVYGQVLLGQALFWFGFVSYLVLLPPLVYRTLIVKSMPEPLVPTIAIFASPASVCLAGYLKVYETPDPWILYLLLALSIASYFAVLALLPRILRMKFYPSYSSLTFPLVISAVATNATYLYLENSNVKILLLDYLAYLEIALAVIIVLYVLIRYVHHFIVKPKVSSR